jgi:cytochrome c
LAATFLASLSLSAAAQTFDEDAAVALAKKSGCLKCHSIDKRKKAPSYKEIAAKFRLRANAEAALIKHLTEAPVVKTEDGDDESHERIKSDNRDDVLNVVRWVLSR